MNLKNWSKKKKIAVVFILFILILFLIPSPTKETRLADIDKQTASPVDVSESHETMEEVVATSASKVQKTTATPVAPTKVTVSQSNALKKAQAYLSYSAFSHDGLVAQLEYEQFSHIDALYGANNVAVDWNEQAAKKAKQYIDYSAFSRGSLIQQLKFEKFTQSQAEYGANSVGL